MLEPSGCWYRWVTPSTSRTDGAEVGTALRLSAVLTGCGTCVFDVERSFENAAYLNHTNPSATSMTVKVPRAAISQTRRSRDGVVVADTSPVAARPGWAG